MKLTRLEIQSLPGIQPGFVLDRIAAGTNLVVAPNAFGKSSLLRALRYLLDTPRPSDPVALALAADFTAANVLYSVRRTGRDVQWLRNGRPSTRPALPPADRMHCYWLLLEDLLRADAGQDQRLVTELKRALGGGYDLDALAGLEAVQRGPRHGQREAGSLQQAMRSRQEVEARYRELIEEAAALPVIEARIDDAVRAEQRIRALEQASALGRAHRRHRELVAAADLFPPDMDQLSGDELGQLMQLHDRRDTRHATLLQQQGLEVAARARRRATGLPGRLPDAAQAKIAGRNLERARRLDQQRLEERRRLTVAAAALAEALGNLGGDAPPTAGASQPSGGLAPHSVSRAETLARQLQNVEADIDGLKRQLDDHPPGAAVPEASAIEADIVRHHSARQALHAWLASRATHVRRQGVALLIAALAAAAALILAQLAGEWPTLAAAGLTLAGVLWALFERRSVDARERFTATGLAEPSAWAPAEARVRLQELDARLAELHFAARRVPEDSARRQRLQTLALSLQTLNRERAALAAELGFDPQLTAAGFDRFVRLQDAHHQAANAWRVAHSTLERLEGEIAQCAERVRAWLQQWPGAESVPADLDALEVTLDALLERNEEAVQADGQLQQTAEERQRLADELAEIEQAERALYARAGLEAGQHAELATRLEGLEAWRAYRQDLYAAQAMEQEARTALTGQAELVARAENDDPDSLELDLERARGAAGELLHLRETRTRLNERLRTAGADLALEQAAAMEATERARLEKRYEEARFSTAASLLLGDVTAAYRNDHEPEVLRDARARFRRFTHHEFDLELDPEAGFLARDLRQQALRPLAELSSGTRMQLLLAVRIAWARQIEQDGLALPLFLDEALTTSDEDRFGEVAMSLEELVAVEGRQVFYLSARKHEAALWAQRTGRRPAVIDLGELRFGRPTTDARDYALDVEPKVPAPNGQSAEDYAALLGVPGLDPTLPSADIHLFHLLRDRLDLLHAFLTRWRISRLGPLRTLLASPAAAQALPDPVERERLEERCRVVQAWWEAWQVGRGAPVSRGVLEESECVSETFIERVAERAALGGGDAATLISDLRAGGVSRFRADAVDALEAWLRRFGHLDPRPPLSAEARRMTALAIARASDDAGSTVDWLEAAKSLEGDAVGPPRDWA